LDLETARSSVKLMPDRGEADRRIFEKTPVFAIARYMDHFDQEGRLKASVPPHILEELAARFSQFMDKRVRSLDVAFGGSVASQRDTFITARRELRVEALVLSGTEKARGSTSKVAKSTPREQAIARAAQLMDTSENNIQRILKKSRRRKTPPQEVKGSES
jgi:CelD/BcsL family acetyltransferase involved in cellulose biosynthesis